MDQDFLEDLSRLVVRPGMSEMKNDYKNQKEEEQYKNADVFNY